MQLSTIGGESKPRDGLLPIARVHETLPRAPAQGLLGRNCVVLADHDNVDLARFLGVLEGQSEFAPVGIDGGGDLTLCQACFYFSDCILGYDLFACEAFGKVEDFDGLGKDDDNPVTKDMKVKHLHIWTELDRASDLFGTVIPDAEARARKL